MPVIKNEYNAKSKGGTELAIAELERYVGEAAMADFQIIPSRFRELKEGLIPIYWVHDTENDPEMKHLEDGGWKKFALLIFVSNWQMQRFIERFDIPWNMCVVIPNGCIPFDPPKPLENDGTIRFIYHTTPHRGLQVLTPAFEALAEEEDVHLDVYSSFSIYGWEERDKPYEPLFEKLRNHSKITYHGARPNEEVREALTNTHLFVYPCIWPETSCRALIEAMSAGVMCMTTNYGCLYETGARLASTYQMQDDLQSLANATYQVMRGLTQHIRKMDRDAMNYVRQDVAMRANEAFSWRTRAHDWFSVLEHARNRWNAKKDT